MILIIGLSIGFILIIYWINWRRNQLQILQNNGIKVPPYSFFTGNLTEIRVKKNVPIHQEWGQRLGKIYGYYTGIHPTVVVGDVDLLKLIQVKDFHLFTERRKVLRPGFDPLKRNESMMISQDGQRWKEVRSILTPTFSSKKIKQTVPFITDAIEALIENITAQGKSGSQEVDIYQLFQMLTLTPSVGQPLALKQMYSVILRIRFYWHHEVFLVTVWQNGLASCR